MVMNIICCAIFIILELILLGISNLLNNNKNKRCFQYANIIYLMSIIFIIAILGFKFGSISVSKLISNILYLTLSIVLMLSFYIFKIINKIRSKNVLVAKEYRSYFIKDNAYYLNSNSILIRTILKCVLFSTSILIILYFSFFSLVANKVYDFINSSFSLDELDYRILPCVILIPLFFLLLNEIISYLDGGVLETVEEELSIEDHLNKEEIKKEKEFFPLYMEYKKIWGKNILADYRPANIKKEELSNEEIRKKEIEIEKLEKRKIAEIISNDKEYKKDLEEIYIHLTKNNCKVTSEIINILKELLNRKDIIISNSNYEELAPILFSYLENSVVRGKKVLVLVENKLYNNLKSRNILKEWFESWFKKLYKKSLRNISEFDEWKAKEEWDILLTTQNELIKYQEDFIRKIQQEQEEIKDIVILVINENSEEIAENILTLSVLTNILNTYFRVDKKKGDDGAQYIILSNETSNLNESINKSLGISARSIILSDKKADDIYSIIWKTDVKNKYYTDIMDGIPKSNIGISNLLSYLPWSQEYDRVEFVDQENFPYEKYIAGMEESKTLLKERPISKEKIMGNYSSFVKYNFISSIMRRENYKLLYIYDRGQNFPLLLKKYHSLGKKEIFLNIITPVYLLRDYFIDNIEYFTNSPIYGYTPKVESDKFKIASYLKEVLTNEKLEISEEDIKVEFLTIKEKIGNIEEELVNLFEEIYSVDILKNDYLTVTNKQVYNIENKKFEEKKFFKMNRAINENGYFQWFENFEVIDTGKKVYRLIPLEHIYQNYLPDQVHYFNGNSFKIDKIDTINKRINISPIENDKFAIYRNKDAINLLKTNKTDKIISRKGSELYTIIKEVSEVEYEIQTLGYFEFIDDISMANQSYLYKELEDSELYTRKYQKNKILTLSIEKKNGVIENCEKIAVTLTVILNEIFKTLFAGNNKYLKAFPMVSEEFFEDGIDEFSKTGYTTPEVLSQILPAKVTVEKSNYEDILGVSKDNKLSIYLLEDSHKDMGLLQAVQDNFEKILELAQDYLNWLNEDNLPEKGWSKEKISIEEKYSFLKYGKEELSEYLSLSETREFLNSILGINEYTDSRRRYYSTIINDETEDEFDKEYEYLKIKIDERKR